MEYKWTDYMGIGFFGTIIGTVLLMAATFPFGM